MGARVDAALRVSPEWAITFTAQLNDDTSAALEQLLTYFSDWTPKLRALLETCGVLWVRPLYTLPPGLAWKHRPGVTIIGDAAHLMSPFAGEGANLAMVDGANLGVAIADALEDSKDVDKAVETFEKIMQARAETSAKESAHNMEAFISDGGAKRAAQIMHTLMASHGPPPS